jgi:DNA polymerase/3'-5' exonuclease PolX
MTTDTQRRIVLPIARAEAQRLAELITPACHRVEIVGSIRRRCPAVGDAELLVIPRYEAGMFPGQAGDSLLDRRLAELVDLGEFRWGPRNGPRWKTLTSDRVGSPGGGGNSGGLKIDVFIADPWQWGVLMVVRTGPADFSRGCVTQRLYGGLLRDDLKVHDWRVWQTVTTGDGGGERKQLDIAREGEPERLVWFMALETPEERDFFEYLQGGYVPPEQR